MKQNGKVSILSSLRQVWQGGYFVKIKTVITGYSISIEQILLSSPLNEIPLEIRHPVFPLPNRTVSYM